SGGDPGGGGGSASGSAAGRRRPGRPCGREDLGEGRRMSTCFSATLPRTLEPLNPRTLTRRLPASLLPLVALAWTPTLVWASEDAPHEPHGIPWATLLFSAVNFTIFAYIVFVRGIGPFA